MDLDAARIVEQVAAACRDATALADRLQVPQWRAWLCNGNTGAALLHAALARRDSAFRRAAFDNLAIALRAADDLDDSLFCGWSGIYTTLRYASEGGRYFRGAMADVRERLSASAAAAAYDPSSASAADTDLVYGAAGQLIALGPDAPLALIRVVEAFAARPEHWFLPVKAAGGARAVDLGVAHGIAGVLGALCTATEATACTGAKHALVRALLQFAGDRCGTKAWPSFATPIDATEPVYPDHWCYGTPGVAAVIELAGMHLGRPQYVEAAVGAMTGVASRVLSAPRTGKAQVGLCHGLAGRALILHRFAKRYPSQLFVDAVRRSLDDLLEVFDTSDFAVLAQSGLLTGGIGVALAIATIEGMVDDRWTEFLALASLP